MTFWDWGFYMHHSSLPHVYSNDSFKVWFTYLLVMHCGHINKSKVCSFSWKTMFMLFRSLSSIFEKKMIFTLLCIGTKFSIAGHSFKLLHSSEKSKVAEFLSMYFKVCTSMMWSPWFKLFRTYIIRLLILTFNHWWSNQTGPWGSIGMQIKMTTQIK